MTLAFVLSEHHRVRELLTMEAALANKLSDARASPLRCAAVSGHPKIVELPLDHGITINKVDPESHEIAPGVAAENERSYLAEVLLARGASSQI